VGSPTTGRPCLPPSAHLLGVRDAGACKKALLERPEAFKHPRLTATSATHGPQANSIQDMARRGAERIFTEFADTEWQAPRRSRRPKGLPDPPAMLFEARMKSEDTGWQAPRRSRRPQSLPDLLAWPLRNRFAGVPEEVVEEDSAYSQEYPKLSSRPQKTPVVSKMMRRPAVQTQVVSPQRLTASGAPSRMEAATSCPQNFRVKPPHPYWTLGALQTC